MAYEHLRDKYKDLEEVLNFLEKAAENFDRISIGKHPEAKDVDAIEDVEEDDEIVYVREVGVTLSREKLKGSENIAELISRIEAELGGEDPMESVVREIMELARYLSSDPEVIRRLPLDIQAELFKIAQDLKKVKRTF